jgi:beta-glucosidase-like glycosyl hydrolase
MLDGYRNEVITKERLQEALERILALKASLSLHAMPREALVPGPEALTVVGNDAHRAIAATVADKTVTLIKDTQTICRCAPKRIGGSACTGSLGSRTSPAPTRPAICVSRRRRWRRPVSKCTSSRTHGSASRRARRGQLPHGAANRSSIADDAYRFQAQ